MQCIKLKPNLGAEIIGVDLRDSLDGTAVRFIGDALVEHEVLVFRDQDITAGQQMRFARYFGDLTVHPFSPNTARHPELIVLDYSEDNPPALTDVWHSDETFREKPPMATILRARIVPEIGGDTLFASMSKAYEGLSEGMKAYIGGLEAIHDFKPFRSLFDNSEAHRLKLRELEDKYPNPAHPIVRAHPVSGKKVLFVNPQFTVRVKDMAEQESRSLLDFLFRQATAPEYQLRLEWRPDTLVFWDNRSVQHYAVHDYYPRRRLLERVTLAGDRPVAAAYDGQARPSAQMPARNKAGGWAVPEDNAGEQKPQRQFERE